MAEDFSLVGKPVIRTDGIEKVTGKARFADDYNMPNQLYGVMVRTEAPHAKILSIDYSQVKDNPNLIACITAEDIPGEKVIGPIKKDQPIFSFEKIVTPGDAVAMLVGEDENELIKIRNLVKVNLEPLPVLTDPLQALDDDAVLIHPELGSNLIIHHPLRKGDVEKGFSESDIILEQTYTTQLIEHAYIEPEAVLAIPLEGDKGIKIIGSIQCPHTARKIVAAALAFPLAKVRIVQAELGGSFGGKDDSMNIIAARAAVAALKTNRPVKIHYKREESVLESYKRHPYKLHYKVGLLNNGKIKAMKIKIVADGGAYSSMSPFVTWRSVVQATGPYEIENVHTDVFAVYTNNPYTGAMRGFGSPQPIFAQESMMDDIAIKLGFTPDELRRINGLRLGSITATGQKLTNHDVNLIKVLDTAVKETDFTRKWLENSYYNKSLRSEEKLKVIKDLNLHEVIVEKEDFIKPECVLRKGIGLAVSYRGCSLGAEGIDAAAAYLSVQTDGSVYLLSGLAENGQGLRTTLSIIAAEVLGIGVENVFYLEQDTGLIPDSGPTVASRSTLMGGGAVKSAAEAVKTRLSKLLREEWNLNNKAKIEFKNGMVYSPAEPSRQISFPELCSLAFKKGICLAALGWYEGPKVNWDEETGQGAAYFTYVYGCQVAEVLVNVITGEVFVQKVTAVHDPGRVINLNGAIGQVYGGVTQGAGYALFEEISCRDGFIRERNFDQFLIPTSKDIDEIVPIFIQGKEKFGAWGGKSLGEPTLELTSAAIANAIRNATGRRFHNLPLNLEEIVLGRKLYPEDLKRGSK